MKSKFGSNALQSYIEFETTNGFVRFGIEDKQLYFERLDFNSEPVKVYLTNQSNQIVTRIVETVVKESIGLDSDTLMVKTKKIILGKTEIESLTSSPLLLLDAIPNKAYQFLGGIIMYKKTGTSAFSGGTNIQVNGSDINYSNVIPYEDLFGALSDRICVLEPNSGLGVKKLKPETGLYLTVTGLDSNVAFSDGIAIISINYQEHDFPYQFDDTEPS